MAGGGGKGWRGDGGGMRKEEKDMDDRRIRETGIEDRLESSGGG